jgi:hypothetical protein
MKQHGFVFLTPPMFTTWQIARSIHNALIGDTPSSPADGGIQLLLATRAAVGKSLERLFELSMKHSSTYMALRGANLGIYWEKIAAECELGPEEIKEVITTYAAARQNYRGRKRDRLTNLVDQWIDMEKKASTLPRPSSSTVTVRLDPLGQTALALQDLQIESAWPPKYLNAQEVTWCTDSRIRDELAGITPATFSAPTPGPIPSNGSSPIEVKKFLCLATLANLKPGENDEWALHMTPVTFAHLRRTWCWVAGAASKICDSLESFIAYTNYVLHNGGKRRVAAIFSHWGGLPENWWSFYAQRAQSGEARDDFWIDHCGRVSVGISVRKKSDGSGLILLLFDPRNQYKHLKRRLTMTSDNWKAELLSQLERGFKPKETYTGGLVTQNLGKDVAECDETELCCAFIQEVAENRITGEGYVRHGTA